MKVALTLCLTSLLSGAVMADDVQIKQAHELAAEQERAVVAKQQYEQRQLRSEERKQIAEAKRAKKRAEVTRKIESRSIKK